MRIVTTKRVACDNAGRKLRGSPAHSVGPRHGWRRNWSPQKRTESKRLTEMGTNQWVTDVAITITNESRQPGTASSNRLSMFSKCLSNILQETRLLMICGRTVAHIINISVLFNYSYISAILFGYPLWQCMPRPPTGAFTALCSTARKRQLTWKIWPK